MMHDELCLLVRSGQRGDRVQILNSNRNSNVVQPEVGHVGEGWPKTIRLDRDSTVVREAQIRVGDLDGENRESVGSSQSNPPGRLACDTLSMSRKEVREESQ